MTYNKDQAESAISTDYNHINVQVFQLIEDLEAAGQASNPRGFKCKEANMATLDINPLYPIMDFSPRRFNWKYLAGELAWYIKADPRIEFISNFSSFWKDVCPSGYANSNYGNILFNTHPSTILGANSSQYSISGDKLSEVNQLEWVYNSLVKDRDTRQAVAFFNAPFFQYEGNKDFVCTMYVNFWIRKGYLDMKVQMRSNDIFFGLSYDAPWFSTLQQSMYLNLKKHYPDLKLGMYYHTADNIHFYERHFELADSILDAGLDASSYKLELKAPLFSFDEKGKMFITEEADDFYDKVSLIVSESKNFKTTMKQEDWKNVLTDLYNITQ